MAVEGIERTPEANGGEGVGRPGLASDLTRARDLVPTEREIAAGASVQDYRFERVDEERRRRSLGSSLRSYLADLNPRRIGKPGLPLVVLALSAMIGEWDEVAIAVVAPEMRTEFGFSLAFLGTLSIAITAFSLLLGPAMGFLADRVKRVWMLRIGGILSNVGPILFGLANGVPQLLGGRVLSGVGLGVTKPAVFPVVTDYYPLRSRARVMSTIGIAAGLGVIVGPIIAGRLAGSFGWRAAVVTLAIAALIVTLGMFLLREPVRGRLDRLEMGASEDEANEEQTPVTWGEAWRAARSITTLRRLWYATPFTMLTRHWILFALPIMFAQEFGAGPGQRGLALSIIGGAGLLGLLLGGPLADRLIVDRPGRIMTWVGVSLIVNAAAVVLLALSPSFWLAVLIALPLGFIQVVLQPSFFALVSLVVPARVRGLGIQTISPWQFLGLLLVPLMAAAADAWGIRTSVWLLAPAFVIPGVIVMSSAFGVARDMRAALAASMAEHEAKRAKAAGRAKMLVCRDVDVSYGGVQVLFGVDLDVEEGEILALLGTNGAGKSTMLRAIAGIQEASNGAIFLDGEDVTHVPPYESARRGIVMVPGGNAIFPTLTVEENLRTAAWMYREDEGYVAERTEQVLAMFPVLRDRIRQQAGSLSGGEQQMVALGQAFLMQPRLLMIDELSLGLAPQIVEQLLDTLRAIHAQGTTIILVEQSVNVALTIAERAVYMEKGEVRYDGRTDELLAQPDLVRSVFMGGAVTGATATMGRKGAAGERELLLDVRDVAISFGGVHALQGVSLEVVAGETVGIIGPNGAGKTTLFDVIAGYLTPDSGSVRFEASDVTAAGPDARARLGLGRSFQNVLLFPSMTVRENIAVAFERHIKARNPALAALWSPGTRTAERRVARRVDGLIELLGLGAYADKFVDELSTGTRRAVDIACVMAAQPRVLLLDEPSSGLAQAETEELGPLLQRLVRETGAGLLIIEHDLPLIAGISDRMYAMELGAVIASGSPGEVLKDERVVAAYLAATESVVSRSGTKRLADLVMGAGAAETTTNGKGR